MNQKAIEDFRENPKFRCHHCGKGIIVFADQLEEAASTSPEELLHISCYQELHPVVHPSSYHEQDGCWNCEHRGYNMRPVCHRGAATLKSGEVKDYGICHAWVKELKR